MTKCEWYVASIFISWSSYATIEVRTKIAHLDSGRRIYLLFSLSMMQKADYVYNYLIKKFSFSV